jgi:hypothetical protein
VRPRIDKAYHRGDTSGKHSLTEQCVSRTAARLYRKLRRRVGDRLLGVACAMLESKTLFNPACETQACAA